MWLNDEASAKAEIARLKSAVKANVRKRRNLKLARDKQTPGIPLGDSQHFETEGSRRTWSTSTHASINSLPPLLQQDSEPISSPSSELSRNLCTYREAELLMHYIDHVFPLQFRFYKPDTSSGGPG